MLTKKINGVAQGPRLKQSLASVVGTTVNRRAFLAQSGLAAGGAALATTVPLGTVKKAKAQAATGSVKKVKSVCTHCSVGCTVIAEVDKGVWVGQEPGFQPRRQTIDDQQCRRRQGDADTDFRQSSSVH